MERRPFHAWICILTVLGGSSVINSDFCRITRWRLQRYIRPSDPLLAVVGSICLLPCVAGFAFFRRPRLIHVIRAKDSIFGNTVNLIEPRTVIQTNERVVVEHHLFRDNSPLQMPTGKQLWWLFFSGVFFSTFCMLPLLIMGLNLYTGVLFACIAIPAFIVGFSTPVFAWVVNFTFLFRPPFQRHEDLLNGCSLQAWSPHYLQLF